MARNKGTFAAPFNFQVKMQEAFDPRTSVSTKADLINKETWPYDGDTIYLYKGLVVSVSDENALYMLVDMSKITASDYSGWLRVDAGNAKQVEIVDNLESDASDKALSAKQGKALMNEISGVKQKLTNIYTYKGSKATYAELPTDAVAGDVWNVEEAYEGHAAGTNWAWTGEAWDALAGNIDLSNYLNKDEVAAAIKVETDRAVAEEGRLAGLIEGVTTVANRADAAAASNTTQIEGLSKSIGDLNLVLNGNDNPDDDITDTVGVIGRLEIVEEKNTAQDTRLTNLEKLVSGGEAGEGGATLLEMVNQNAADIEALQTTVGSTESGKESGLALLIKQNADAIELLNSDAETEGSVDYKIKQAFAWVYVE